MKIKNIIINNTEYVYRLLSVEDFLSFSKETDFNIFETQKELTMYEKIIKNINSDNNKIVEYDDVFYDNIIENVLKTCLINYDIENFSDIDFSQNVKLFLFNNIVISSLKAFKIPNTIDKHSALIIDNLCKRYGKLPIEFIFESHEYNLLDSYFFNKEICSIGMKNDLKNIKKI